MFKTIHSVYPCLHWGEWFISGGLGGMRSPEVTLDFHFDACLVRGEVHAHAKEK
jgi:hypothetical protein